MPLWPAIAGSVRELLLTPPHPAWLAQVHDIVLAVAPPGTPLPDELHRVLLDGPDVLPLPVLDWLANRVMYPARSLTSDREHGRAGSRYPAGPLPGDPFPRVAELRFAVPARRRIVIYDELIGNLESRLREARERHDDYIRTPRLPARRSQRSAAAGRRALTAASSNLRLVAAVTDLAMRQPPSPNQQSHIVLGCTRVARWDAATGQTERTHADASSGGAACGGCSDVDRLSGRLGGR